MNPIVTTEQRYENQTVNATMYAVLDSEHSVRAMFADRFRAQIWIDTQTHGSGYRISMCNVVIDGLRFPV